MTLEERSEIRDIITFYDTKGWDWGDIVAYLSAKYCGYWPFGRLLRPNRVK